MNEKLIQETIKLIRLSGHVIEGQLMFEPWSDRAMHFIDGLAPQGYSLHAKLPEPLEQELIDWRIKIAIFGLWRADMCCGWKLKGCWLGQRHMNFHFC